ncbi:hypothetical protein OAK35_01775 [Crocinitomicaceae bacterium]|nr:hypothetical protein [Crocinitomicaceae bacterium]MDC0257450.1 hypothetical protein [Crocinitomicaceae bacterium]
MLRTILFSLPLLLIGFSVSAQELDIDWGEEFDSKSEIQKILGLSSDGTLVAYSIKGKNRYIETYAENTMKLTNTADYELPDLGGKVNGMLNVALIGNEVNMLLYSYSKKTRSFKLYVQTLEINGKEKSAPKEIYDSGASDEKAKDAKVDVVFSPDNTKAVVFFDRSDRDRLTFSSDNLVINLEGELSVVSTSKFEFEIRSDKSENVTHKAYHQVENDGSFTIVREKLESKILKILDFGLEVGRYDSNGELLGESEIKKDGMIFMSPTMITTNGQTKMVGYYMNNKKGSSLISGYSGMFVADFSSEMEMLNMQTNEFSYDFMRNVYGKRYVARMEDKGKEIRVPAQYTMNDIFIHEDGSMTVLSEFFQQVSTTERGQTTTTTTYGSILYFKLDAEGELVASDAIRKLQRSSTSTIGIGISFGGVMMFASIELPDKMMKYWSYAASMKDDVLYLVFNDHFKNQDYGEDELKRALANPKKGVPYLTTIDTDGSFDKKAMVDSGDSETYLVPQVTYGMEESQFIIWGIWRKANKFGVASID